MYYQGFHHVLTGLFLLVPIGFLVTYLVAVFNDHVVAGFPYISDTGAFPPESCIFGQVLDFGAFLLIILVYSRYHHVKSILNSDIATFGYLEKFNKLGFFLGSVIVLGITLVGNFQEQNVYDVHMLGAMLAFGLLIVYCSLQTYLSKVLSFALHSPKSILFIRVVLSLLGLIFFILTMTFSFIAWANLTADRETFDPRKWKPEDGGFDEHLVSTIGEWLMAFTEIIYLFTFYTDYKRIKLKHPEICANSKSSLVVSTTSYQTMF